MPGDRQGVAHLLVVSGQSTAASRAQGTCVSPEAGAWWRSPCPHPLRSLLLLFPWGRDKHWEPPWEEAHAGLWSSGLALSPGRSMFYIEPLFTGDGIRPHPPHRVSGNLRSPQVTRLPLSSPQQVSMGCPLGASTILGMEVADKVLALLEAPFHMGRRKRARKCRLWSAVIRMNAKEEDGAG